MEVNVNLSEVGNVVRHINQFNEWPIDERDVEIIQPTVVMDGIPKYLTIDEVKKEYDAFYTKGQRSILWRLQNVNNTEVSVRALRSSNRWNSQAERVKYRRIHLGFQWAIYNIASHMEINRYKDEFDRVEVIFNPWKNKTVLLSDVYRIVGRIGKFKESSLTIKIKDFRNNGFDYDTGTVSVEPIPNSLIYIGAFSLKAVFKPVSFLPKSLPGFKAGVEDNEGIQQIPKGLGSFVHGPEIPEGTRHLVPKGLNGFTGYTDTVNDILTGFGW